MTTNMMHWMGISHCGVVRHKSSEVEVEIVDVKSPSKVWIHLIEDSACRSMGGGLDILSSQGWEAWTSYRVQIEAQLHMQGIGLISIN